VAVLVKALVLFEDDHLLVVRKPPGVNTHASGVFAGEGIYDWLKRREPRWADLAIVQRLDKETSGVMVFSKTPRGNASLTKQFSRRWVTKEYALLTDRRPPADRWVARSWIRKGRGRFESLPEAGDGLEAETEFVTLGAANGRWELKATPRTGRTHQIRLHAADHGIPILGDTLYGGSAWGRLCLHARLLRFRNPATNEWIEFVDAPRFEDDAGAALRAAFIDPEGTNAHRVIHGASDRRPGWQVDRLGDYLLASHAEPPAGGIPEWLPELAERTGCRGIYVRALERRVREAAPEDVSPRLAWGEAAPAEFPIRENGVTYLLSFEEGYSTGLFLDQRENRRRLLTNWIGPAFPGVSAGAEGGRATVLNVFAYTCGFSVAAAMAGARTTSLDLSRKYLAWGQRNFAANGLDAADHDFVYGDAMDWMRRWARKGRVFDAVLLDPPTFSQSRARGVFRVERDFQELVATAARVLRPGGLLFASTNAARLEPEAFLTMTRSGLHAAGFRVAQELFVPQPPDFPTCREEPGYLKTLWARVGR
jgi:23S rRNA (cytosine1962-C5)-methyltransferase